MVKASPVKNKNILVGGRFATTEFIKDLSYKIYDSISTAVDISTPLDKIEQCLIDFNDTIEILKQIK